MSDPRRKSQSGRGSITESKRESKRNSVIGTPRDRETVSKEPAQSNFNKKPTNLGTEANIDLSRRPSDEEDSKTPRDPSDPNINTRLKIRGQNSNTDVGKQGDTDTEELASSGKSKTDPKKGSQDSSLNKIKLNKKGYKKPNDGVGNLDIVGKDKLDQEQATNHDGDNRSRMAGGKKKRKRRNVDNTDPSNMDLNGTDNNSGHNNKKKKKFVYFEKKIFKFFIC